MPSDNFSRPTGGRKKLKRKPAAKPAPAKPSPPPRTDVQSSGSDYGTRKAKAYKKTPEYKRTVRVVRKREQAKRALKPGRVNLDEVQTAGFGGALDSVAGKISGVVDEVAPKFARGVLAFGTLGASELPIIGKGHRKIVGNAAKDIVNLPVQTVPSVYHLGERVVEGKVDEAAEMLIQPYKDLVKDPGKAFTEHPINNALLVAGPVRGTTRATGAVMRKVPGPTRRLASTKRASRTLPGTSLRETRSYSPDPVVKAGQVAREKVKLRKARKLRKQADRVEEQSVEQAAELRAKADRTDPTRIKPTEIRRRVDERVAVNEDVRRANRTETVNETRKLLRPARGGGASLNVIAQNIVRADKADIAAYVRELEAEFPSLGKAGQRANLKLRQELQQVIKDKHWDAGEVEVAVRKYAEANRGLQDDLVRLKVLAPEQADSRLVPYAVRRMGAETIAEWEPGARNPTRRLVRPGPDFAKFKAAEKRLERARQEYTEARGEPDGNVVRAALELDNAKADLATARKNAYRDLSKAEVREHMRANNVSEPAWVSQAPNARGGRNFYVSSDRAPSIGNLRRTGEATRKGTFDADPETLVEANARAQGLRDAASGFRKFIGEFAATNERGKVRTYNSHGKAAEAARELSATNGVALRPVRINPWAGSREQLQKLLDDIDDESAQSHGAIVDAITDAAKGNDGPGPWALIPEVAADQLAKHMRILDSSTAGKVGQIINNAFRQTVLAMSPKWLFGNPAEASVRAAVAGAGPRSHMTASRVLKRAEQIDPEKAKELRARTVGGGHFSMAERQRTHRDASQFQGTSLEGVARGLGAFWRSPGPKQLADFWHGYTQFVFRTLNGNTESQFQVALLGKELRRSPLMDGHTFKLSEKAIDQAARRLLNTDEQVAFGRAVDRMYGKYGKFGPNERRMIALYTPFIAWSLNAVRFVYSVLPRDHPVITSLISSAELATEEWRKERGLDLFMKEAVPSFLQGSIPGKDGSHLRLSRYTPFGAFADPGATFGDAVLPQFSGVLAALKDGEDWKGDKLQVDGRDANVLERIGFAAQYFVEATIPALNQGLTIAQGEGPLTDRLRKQYDPLRYTPGSKGKLTKVSGREAELLRREAEALSGGGPSEREMELLRREAELLKGGD